MKKPSDGVDILDGYFTCYRDGRVWSNKTNRFVGHKHPTGYIVVSSPNGGNYKAHRLIAHAFLGLDLLSDLTVDHLNRIKDDNRVSNLEIVTVKINVARATSKYTTELREIEQSLSDTKSWTITAKVLGFSTAATLQKYCTNRLGIDYRLLSEKYGAIMRSGNSRPNYIRNNYSLEMLKGVISESGSISAAAKVLGVSRTSLSRILKEKSDDDNSGESA